MTIDDDPWMNEGGPAFPVIYDEYNEATRVVFKGITVRDYFAAQALAGMTAGITRFRDDAADIIVNRPQDISEIAYVYADAMLAERAKGKPE